MSWDVRLKSQRATGDSPARLWMRMLHDQLIPARLQLPRQMRMHGPESSASLKGPGYSGPSTQHLLPHLASTPSLILPPECSENRLITCQENVHLYTCIYVYMNICMHVSMYTCIHVQMYICIYVCMYVCIHVIMYACIYAYMWYAPPPPPPVPRLCLISYIFSGNLHFLVKLGHQGWVCVCVPQFYN